LGGTTLEAIRAIENDKERRIFAELGLHAAVCYHFCLEMSSERRGKAAPNQACRAIDGSGRFWEAVTQTSKGALFV